MLKNSEIINIQKNFKEVNVNLQHLHAFHAHTRAVLGVGVPMYVHQRHFTKYKALAAAAAESIQAEELNLYGL